MSLEAGAAPSFIATLGMVLRVVLVAAVLLPGALMAIILRRRSG